MFSVMLQWGKGVLDTLTIALFQSRDYSIMDMPWQGFGNRKL